MAKATYFTEMVIHRGKTEAQVARELRCSEYSLNLWNQAYLSQQAPPEIGGQQRSPEQMFTEFGDCRKNEYLKRQREILKKAMSILGEEPNPGMR